MAQPAPGRLPRIVFLGTSSPANFDPRVIPAFKAGLQEHRLIDGQTVTVEYDWANGDAERLRALAQALAKGGYDVIVTAGPQAAREFLSTGTTTPIVLAVIGDPVGDGLVKSLARPGGTMTGLSMANAELESKRLEILKAAVPAITRVMLLHDVTAIRRASVEEIEQAGHERGLQTLVVNASKMEDFAPAFAKAVEAKADGLVVLASPFLNYHRRELIDLANRHRLPSIWETDVFARDGGLMSYGPNFVEMYRRSAGYVAKILKGAKPADLPVEQPTRFELVVNLATAKLLGLTFPQSFLARADDLVE